MRLHMLTAALVLLAAGSIVPAESADKDGGRYKMSPVDDGFVRLDTETGAMSLCTRSGAGWSCKAMPEGQETDGDELARLRKENSELQEENRRMEETFGLDARGSRGDEKSQDGDFDAEKGPKPEIQLPDEEQVDQAIDYLEGMIRKFRERFEDFGEKTKPHSRPNRDEEPAPDETTPL